SEVDGSDCTIFKVISTGSFDSATLRLGLRAKVYGVAAAVAAGDAGAGLPKLKFTAGGFSAPAWASKNGRGWKPNIPANRFVGKVRTATLYSCTALLKFPRSTEIRFSVPSNCACKFWKFCVARSSG